MAFAADPPPVVVAAPIARPAEVVVVSRDTRSEVIVSRDTPLSLVKGGRTEDALLRQAIFMTATVTVVRPAGGGAETLRWTYRSYLQHQLCFTSMTGQFSCVAPELEDLTETAEGEAPLAAAPGQAAPARSRAAEDARADVATALGIRAASLFEADRLRKLDPMLKAAGVSIRRTPVSVRSRRR